MGFTLGVYVFEKPKKKNRVLLCLWLDEDTFKDFEKIAKKFKISPNQLAKETIKVLIDEYKKFAKSKFEKDLDILYS